MARLNDASQILSKLNKIYQYAVPLTSPISQPLNADAAADAATISFASITGFTVNSRAIIDPGSLNAELVKFGTPATTMPLLDSKLHMAHLTGVSVKQCAQRDCGYIEEGGVSLGGSSSQQSVSAANATGKIWTGANEAGELTAAWKVRESNLEGILSAYGIDDAAVKGTGGANDAYRILIHPTNVLSLVNFAWVFEGLLANLKTAYVSFMNPTPTLNISAALGSKGAPTTWDVSCVYTHKTIHII